MNCPACGNAMTQMTVGKVTVDVCRDGCGGLWFDRFELRTVDEPGESAGEALLEAPRNPRVAVDRTQRLRCPHHPDMVMMRHLWSVKRQVTIDECPRCAGVFLDPGELGQIRSEYGTDAERREAARAYYAEMFDQHLSGMLAQDRSKLEHARRFAGMFRFICPSYYLPGKQEWGAF